MMSRPARMNDQRLSADAAIERPHRPSIGRHHEQHRDVRDLIDRRAGRDDARVRPGLALALQRDADNERPRRDGTTRRHGDAHRVLRDVVFPVGRLVLVAVHDRLVLHQNAAFRLTRLSRLQT